MTNKRIATQDEKKAFFNVLLDELIEGNGDVNALTRRVGRQIPVVLAKEDGDALFERIMKTPKQIDVKALFDDILCRSDMEDLSDLEVAFRDAPKKLTPKVTVLFKHFTAPPSCVGGWRACADTHPMMEAWAVVFRKYRDYIITSSRNTNNVRFAVTNNLPIDIVITHGHGYDTKKSKPVLMRVVVFEPLPEDQKGFDLYAEKEGGGEEEDVEIEGQ